MALTYKWPGVYPTITDLSQIVSANSETVCAYVGEAEYGPINKPTNISGLKGYTEKFGGLHPKYGLAGYSLAVAQDTINSHYFVRVVDAETAKFGAAVIPLEGQSAEYTDGYAVKDIQPIIEDEGDVAGALYSVLGDTVADKTAMIVMAQNPNNQTIKVSISDSTIIEAKAELVDELSIVPSVKVDAPISVPEGMTSINVQYAVTYILKPLIEEASSNLQINYIQETDGEGVIVKSFVRISNPNKVTFSLSDDKGGALLESFGLTARSYNTTVVEGTAIDPSITWDSDRGIITISEIPYAVTIKTISQVNDPADEEHYLEVGDKVTLTNSSDLSYNGTYKVISVDDHQFSILLNKQVETLSPSKTRWVRYPEITETTFDIAVYLTTGKITTKVEQFNGLTLYTHKDNVGASTFAEDVINGKSNYITVYANPSKDFTEDENQISYPSYVQLVGNTSGTVGVSSAALNAGWDKFKDRSQTDVTLLMGSGYTSVEYQSKMLEVAEDRRDCFCLFDVPKTDTLEENALDWRKNVQGFNTYRGALSTPWIKTYDSIQGKSGFLMAPSAYIAKVLGLSDPWVAPAGLNRGMLTSSTVTPVGLTAYYDETAGGNLYSAQLNCIVKNPGAGYVNWGQKTLQQKPSALDRINVARTVIYIETTLREAAKYHLFENNTSFERTQITLQFSQFLDRVLAANGLTKYQVVCDETNNTPYIIANNQLVIDIYLWPVYTAEYIILNTTVMGPDAIVTVSTAS